MHDLVICGGNVVDGSGSPAYTADVGVTAGRIAEVGRLREGGRVELDATGQVVSLRTGCGIPVERVPMALNGRLPPDARVRRVQERDEAFHARFSATARTYRYIVRRAGTPSVFRDRYSLLATGALLLLAPPLRERFARRLPRWLAEALAVPTAATLVCSPLIASFAGQISVAAVPANLLAEPAVAPATILGVVTTCVAPWWTTGARWIAHVAALPCAWLVWVAGAFARLPGAAVSWPTGAAGAADLALVVLVFVAGLRLLARARDGGGS